MQLRGTNRSGVLLAALLGNDLLLPGGIFGGGAARLREGAPPPTGPLRKLAPLGELNLISLFHLVGRPCARIVVCGVLRGVSIVSESPETRRSSHSYNVCQHLS